MHIKKANDDSLEETIRLSKGKNVFERIFDFIKICQNTPQLCWGDEWLTLSPPRLCRNPILMVAAGFSLRATH